MIHITVDAADAVHGVYGVLLMVIIIGIIGINVMRETGYISMVRAQCYMAALIGLSANVELQTHNWVLFWFFIGLAVLTLIFAGYTRWRERDTTPKPTAEPLPPKPEPTPYVKPVTPVAVVSPPKASAENTTEVDKKTP